jgi:opacity protein-like surface antigen
MWSIESEHHEQEHRYYSSGQQQVCSNLIRLFLLVALSSYIAPLSNAQKQTDLGVFTGGSYYMGDINMERHFYAPSFAAGPIIRYNFNPRHSLRLNTVYGTLQGNDLDFDNEFQRLRGHSFTTTFLDIGLNFEFNFLPYKIYQRKDIWSPYITGGLGYNRVLSSTPSSLPSTLYPAVSPAKNNMIITFGGGFKLTLSRRWAAGTEWTFRKTFSDSFDGLENPGQEFNTFFHNNDWYYLVGVFVTYKFWEYMEDCPAYDNDKESWKGR